MDGKTTWEEYQDDEDGYGYDQEVFKPNYKSDKNVKRVAGLPPKVPLNMIDYLKEILFEPITEAEMISKYALSLGWGSCSGCDALQACSTISEVQDLMDNLQNSIMWFFDSAEALEFFEEHDWEGDYSWHIKEQHEFIDKSIEILKNLN